MDMNWYTPIPHARDVTRACRTYADDSYVRRCAPTHISTPSHQWVPAWRLMRLASSFVTRV